MRKFISLLLSVSLIMTVAAVSGATITVSAAETLLIDWTKFGGYSDFTTVKDDPAGYIHVSGNKDSMNSEYIVILGWWGLNPKNYDKIQFKAYGSGTIRLKYGDNTECADVVLSSEATTITVNVSDFKDFTKGDIKFQAKGIKGNALAFDVRIGDIYGITGDSTTTTTTTTTTAAPETTTPSSGQTKTTLIDWTKAKDAYAESEPNINLKLDDPTGYIHASGTTQKNSNYSDIIVFWGLNLEGYDQIQFTAYGTGSIRFKLNNNTEYDDYVLSGNSTTITLDVSNFTGTSYPFRFQVLTNKQPTAIDIHIGDIYGIKGGSTTPLPTVKMETGAAMRIDGLTYGIRFSATVSTDDLTEFKNEGNKIKDFGMLIAPAESNLTTANMIVDNSQELKEVGTLASGKNSVVAKYNGLYPMDHAASGLTQIVGSLVEIAKSNANKQYVARAYVEYTDKTGAIKYLYSDISDARSLAWVAYTIRKEGLADSTNKNLYYNQLCEKHKFEVNKWANLYKSSETTTTITGTTQQMSTFIPNVGDTGEIVVDWDQNQQKVFDPGLERVWKEGTTQTDAIQDYVYLKNNTALTAGKGYLGCTWWNDFNGYHKFKFYAQGFTGTMKIELTKVKAKNPDGTTSSENYSISIPLTSEFRLYSVTLADYVDVTDGLRQDAKFYLIPDSNISTIGGLQFYLSDFYTDKSAS